MSASGYFERLGIAPTRDTKEIKRAYALALKAIDQSTEREAFERLRQAYEGARTWAQSSHDDDVLVVTTQAAGQPDGQPVAEPAGEVPSPRVSASVEPPAIEPRVGEPATHDPATHDPANHDSVPVQQHADADVANAQAPAPQSPDGAQGTAPSRPDAADPPRSAPHTLISNESYGASRMAARQWINRLFNPKQARLEDIFEQAFVDPRLAHLDSRAQLEVQLIEALYRDRPGHAELFMLAAERFGWNERNARPAGPSYCADWVHQVINQQLSWRVQAPEVVAEQQAAIDAALASNTPTSEQAFNHSKALQAFHEGFAAWAELVMPVGRIAVWRGAYDKLSPGWISAAQRRQYLPRNFSRFAATIVLVIVAISLVYGMFKPTRVAAPAGQVAGGVAGTSSSPTSPDKEPVLAYEFTGPITKDSCEMTRQFVHQSNWLTSGDADAIALLSTRAFLCQDHKLWPQGTDPFMDCLRAERGAAFTAGRVEQPQACEAKQPAAK